MVKVYCFLRLTLIVMAFFPMIGKCAIETKSDLSDTASALNQELLIPWRTITGGQLVTQQDQNGFPVPGSIKGFVTFISPSAIAARLPDLYIADAGTRKIYRFNSDMQSLSIVAGADASALTRLQVSSDYSLYVLDPSRSIISSIGRGSQRLQALSSPVTSAHITEFMIDDAQGRIFAVDQLNQQIIPIRPMGSADMPLNASSAGEIRQLGALASFDRMIYAIDSGCVCIVEIDEAGHVRERIGQGELIQPRSMVADKYGRLFVADGFNHTLKIYLRGALIASYSANKLHTIDITALAIDQSTLYVADGPGAKIVSFRVRLP